MEKLERICDNVAFAIDDVDGNLSLDQIEILLSEILEPTEYNREQFDEIFQNVYQCDIKHYVSNAVDDADWATKNGLYDSSDDLILDSEEIVEIDPTDLGITVMSDDEIY